MPSMESNTVASRTMASTLATGIRSDIISGIWQPGSKLRIKELCERYGAGAIPMREALSRLATSGFVIAEDQRGFRVSEVSAQELTDITETRVHVECEALRQSVLNGGLDWEEKLIGAHYRLSRLPMLVSGVPGLDPEWECAHVAFHAALLSGCTSKWLKSLSDLLRDQTARYRNLSVVARPKTPKGTKARRQESARDVAAEHQQMVEAALSRDAERACALLAEHFRATTQLVLARNAIA
jgi:GntR family carbon starvation induced transcriptional regulator